MEFQQTQGAAQPSTYSEVVAERQQLSEQQRKQLEDQRRRLEKKKIDDLKVKNFLFQAIDRNIGDHSQQGECKEYMGLDETKVSRHNQSEESSEAGFEEGI